MSRIGRYQIESEIGRGAMGIVYLADDPRLGRRVAVKTYELPVGLSSERVAEFQQRFQREARAAAALSHPGIVTVYDAGEDPERKLSYIAMEYVPGKSLQQVLRSEGAFCVDRVAATVASLTAALRMAHEAGIVHRDIKPANILLRDSDGAVKIADFGIAKVPSSTLTQSGQCFGSPAYMSPEQIRGSRIDARSDLFSLAIIVYEMLSGTRPFSGDDSPALLYSIVHKNAVPVTTHREELPGGLDRFFDKALAKDPENRFPDADSFQRAFELAITEAAAIDVERTARRELAAAGSASVAKAVVPVDMTSLTRRSNETLGAEGPGRRLTWIAATLFLVAFGAWALVGGTAETYLKLDAKSGLASGDLILSVDDHEVYRRELTAPRSKRGLLKKVLHKDLETFEAWIEVTPGKHEIVAQVLGEGEVSGYRDTVVVDLERGETRQLKLTVGRAFGPALSLKVN